MAMDLNSIRDINGPQRETQSRQRAASVASNSTPKLQQHDQQVAHGNRVSARAAINGQPLKA